MSIASTILMNYGDANDIRSLAAFFFGQLLAGGMVQTADTGQTANNAFPQADQAVSGYQIWRFNDSLQGSYPVYVKIELGGALTLAWAEGIWITVGKGSDGVGNITGILVPRTAIGPNNLNVSNMCYISSSNNRFSIALWPGTSNGSMVISLERTKDVTGADTNDGVIFQGFGALTGNSFKYSQFSLSAVSVGPFTSPTILNGNPTTSMAGSSGIGILPILPFGPSGIVNPGIQLLAYYGPDLPAFNPISITINGTQHTYLPLGNGSISGVATGWALSTLAMLYE